MPDNEEAPRAPVPVTIGPKGVLAHMDLRGHGNFVQVANFGTQYINRDSTVFANICEVGTAPLDYPFVGDARMQVCNIAPQDDGTVLLWLEVEWGSDLNLRVRFVIA